MINFEQLSGDPDISDCYAVLFQHSETHIGFVASRAANLVPIPYLQRLNAAIRSCELAHKLEEFGMPPTMIHGRNCTTMVVGISFAVKNDNEKYISKFLEYARQCRVLPNPIVSDLRSFKLK